MRSLNCLLIGEGSTDQCLLPILRWLIAKTTPAEARIEWMDTTLLWGKRSLGERVAEARRIKPVDLLFIHRDADSRDPAPRIQEIQSAAGAQRHIAIVPVQMTEAWLLIDEGAIRRAASRPSGREPLGLPEVKALEKIADPKKVLREALYHAHAATGRRRDRFEPEAAVHRVAQLIEDWSPLLHLGAFQRVATDLHDTLRAMGTPVNDVPPPSP